MNNRFPILSFVSMLLKFFGWLFVVIGILYAVGKGIYKIAFNRQVYEQSDQCRLQVAFSIKQKGIFV